MNWALLLLNSFLPLGKSSSLYSFFKLPISFVVFSSLEKPMIFVKAPVFYANNHDDDDGIKSTFLFCLL
jgi:hypothetical protein